MFKNISILIANSSHASVDGILSTLKEKILSAQRPHIACISYDDFHDELSSGNFERFFRDFIKNKLDQRQIILNKLQQRNEFNQLEFWKRDTKVTAKKIKKDKTLKNQLCMLKRDELREIILDFPIGKEIELYLILFDVYDCRAIKSIADFVQRGSNDECLMGIVNFYPRDLEMCHEGRRME